MVIADDAGRIRQFLEKPTPQQATSKCVNAGIYVLEPRLLDEIKGNSACDFSLDIFPQMLAQNQALFGYVADGYWRDIGTMQSYQQCLVDVETGKVDLACDSTPGWEAMDESTRKVDGSFAESLGIPYASLEALKEQKVPELVVR